MPDYGRHATGRISIKKKIRRGIWDNGWAKTNSEEGKAINAYLKQIESEVFHYYRDILASRKMITADGLKNAYLGIQSRNHRMKKFYNIIKIIV